jgi:hypothetical protein
MREGRGECMGVSMDFGGDFGDCTSTLGGDLVFERGGEKAIRDVGRGLERLAGVSNALPRGVAGPFAVESDKWDVDIRPGYSLEMSRDMRPSPLLCSSGIKRSGRSGVPGVRGVGGAGDLFELSMLSKWLRREDTGF